MSKKTVIFTAGTLLGISIAVSLSASADRLSQFNEMAARKGAQYGVNPNFIKAIVSVESAGRIDAVSPVGARGLMQLMPATAERMGVSRHELFQPERNMDAGVKYISYLNRLFNNDPRLVAAAYNAGEGAVQKYGGVPPYRETQNYAPAVVARYRLLEACGDACYTKEHMSNPQKYLNSPMLQQVSPTQQNSFSMSSWLGQKPQNNIISQTGGVTQKPTIKSVNVAVQQPIQKPQSTHVNPRRHNNGFVQVLQNDGSYDNLSSNSF